MACYFLRQLCIYKEKLLEHWNTAVVGSCSTWQHCNWHSHFHAATIGLPEVWRAALKRSTSSFFWPLNWRPFLYLLIIPSKTASVIFSAGPCFIRSYFSCFSLFAASLSFFSWHSSHSQCPSISASVLLLREECHLVMELVEFSGWTDENQD